MSKNKIMPWVDALPNVEATDFQARRDQIEATMAEAAELVKQAEELRGKAYFAALSLMANTRIRRWARASAWRRKWRMAAARMCRLRASKSAAKLP